MTPETHSLEKIAFLYETCIANHDEVNAEKARQLFEKVQKQEFAIAFCGHFSAGKSSMINEMLGESLLPSSPIPTSANIVKVKSGEAYAKVYYKNSLPVQYSAPYNYEKVKQFCVDGDFVEQIEISYKTNNLPENVVIMDTPGIDSTDDAHRLSTESTLHIADVIFYVMDYNHVQAELNFQFTKELSDLGKRLYLIVNQIDKHQEHELVFSDFQRGSIEAFESWGISFERMFFTSIRENVPHNELPNLKTLLQDLFVKKEQLFLETWKSAALQLVEAHKTYRDNQVATFSKETVLEVQKEYEQLTEKLHEHENLLQTKRKSFELELRKTLDNAYLMPFETREKAQMYLESLQSGFKIGFLFTKGKTEEEKVKRRDTFYESLKESVHAQLEWHVRTMLVAFLHDIQETNLSAAQNITVEFSTDTLQALVKPGAFVSGDYVLTYTNDVANDLKKRCERRVRELFDSSYTKWESLERKQTAEWKKKYDMLHSQVQKINDAALEIENCKETSKQLHTIFESDVPCHTDITKLANEIASQEIIYRDGKETWELEKNEIIENQEVAVTLEAKRDRVRTPEEIATVLFRVAELIQPFDTFTRLRQELMDRANRLQTRSYTVSLFGAFSAGKSSFANALMGKKLLPSSPNPTTATINKVAPATEEHPHGEVVVVWKSEAELLDEINHSLRIFNEKANSLQEAITKAKKINDTDDLHEKPHVAFLQTVSAHLDMEKLGMTESVSTEQFQVYVADETKACFIQTITMHYDCPLTKERITLVDTPGVDSINSRHTGVTHEFIKNTDAVFFVTYYNHAFAKADREFLIQLGRVKDTFAMDKMFFIINAVDLANNENDVKMVINYVQNELAKFGIQRPRLYPVSSQLALQEKEECTQKNSGMDLFEQDFHAFVKDTLTKMAVDAAELEIEKVYKTFFSIVTEASRSEQEKQKKVEFLRVERADITEMVQTQNHVLWQTIEQEIKELLYYVKQRIFLRYHEWFKESFNPADLRDDTDKKKALRSSLKQLKNAFAFDLTQEMRATTLRVEQFIEKKLRQKHLDVIDFISHINEQLAVHDVEAYDFPIMNFMEVFTNVTEDYFASALRLFKNAKAFFEKGESRKMQEELERLFQQPVNDYISEQQNIFYKHYETEWLNSVSKSVNETLLQVADYYEGLEVALTKQIDINAYKYVMEELKKEL